MARDKKGRKLLDPNKTNLPQVQVTTLPSIQTMLDDALSVVNAEIIRLKYKVNYDPKENKGLSPNETRMLHGHISSLVNLSKEARERQDEMELANMSDDELVALVESIKAKKEGK